MIFFASYNFFVTLNFFFKSLSSALFWNRMVCDTKILSNTSSMLIMCNTNFFFSPFIVCQLKSELNPQTLTLWMEFSKADCVHEFHYKRVSKKNCLKEEKKIGVDIERALLDCIANTHWNDFFIFKLRRYFYKIIESV